MSSLKARVAGNEEDITSIPDLIKMEFRLANSQNARMSRDIADLQRTVGDLQRNVEAMPRAVAELVVEVIAERDRKR
jgi:hypothetical protein